MTPAAKNWWQSKTLAFNALSALVIIAGIFIDPSLGFDPRIVAVAAAIVTAGNALLRVFSTNTAIAGTPAAAGPAPAPTTVLTMPKPLDTLPPTS